MLQKFGFSLFFIVFRLGVFGQDTGHITTGKVSFITSQNVYIKFDNTDFLNIGDTLQLPGKKTPCLVIKNKSSNSCVCVIINACEIKINDEVIYSKSVNPGESIKKENIINQSINVGKDSSETNIQKGKISKYEEDIKGRISVSSYNNISDTRDDRYRLMSHFSLNANNINNSAFSVETYLNYRQIFDSAQTSANLNKNALKVYNLALRYDINPGFSLILGRKINPKVSSLGAIDGLQLEKFFGKNYIGIISGFRPDILDYNFNSKLFEYGGYIGRSTDAENFYSQTTLGLIEQQNNGKTDRRFTYFQHSSTIFKKLNIFSSLELDIYNKMRDTTGNAVRITNLYMSARYRFNKKFDVTLSFDSRKRIFYYESFQTEIEQLLNDDIARQGARIRANIKPVKYVTAGLSYGRRFQSDNQNKSENIYGYASLSKIPGVGGLLSINYNLNTSNYLESKALSFRHSRTLIKKKLDADFYYRRVNYTYLYGERKLLQNYYGANFSYQINRKLMFSISGELSDYNQENNYRVYAKIVKRFYKNTKK